MGSAFKISTIYAYAIIEKSKVMALGFKNCYFISLFLGFLCLHGSNYMEFEGDHLLVQLITQSYCDGDVSLLSMILEKVSLEWFWLFASPIC